MALSTDNQGLCQLCDDAERASAPIDAKKEKGSRYSKFQLVSVLLLAAVALICLVLLTNILKGTALKHENVLVSFTERRQAEPISVTAAGRTVWTKSYDVAFAPAEQVLVLAEFYEIDKPMRLLDAGILAGSTDTQRMTVVFARAHNTKKENITGHSVRIELNGLVLEIPEFLINDAASPGDMVITWFRGGQLRNDTHSAFAALLTCHSIDSNSSKRIWIPGLGVSTGIRSRFVLKMIPVSRLDSFAIDPVPGSQGLDGHIITDHLNFEQSSMIAQQYKRTMTASVVRLTRNGF